MVLRIATTPTKIKLLLHRIAALTYDETNVRHKCYMLYALISDITFLKLYLTYLNTIWISNRTSGEYRYIQLNSNYLELFFITAHLILLLMFIIVK